MAGKFMKITRLVLPFMTVVILASQLMGCAALSKQQMLDELNKADEVVIEYVEPARTPLADTSETESSYDYEDNTVSVTESEIGLIDTEGEKGSSTIIEVKQDLTLDQLKPYFQQAFDMSEFLGGGMEDHIQFELGEISSLVSQANIGNLPSDYETQFRNWRPLRLREHFRECTDTVYATGTVNLRGGPSTDYEKVGSLKSGDSVVRTGTGIDQFENWSRIQLADGSEVYVNNNYISTTKPVVQQSTKASGGSSTAAKPSSQSSGASSSTVSSGGGGASGGGASGGGASGGFSGGDQARPGQGTSRLDGYDSGNHFEEGAAEGVYGDPSVRVNMG